MTVDELTAECEKLAGNGSRHENRVLSLAHDAYVVVFDGPIGREEVLKNCDVESNFVR